MTIKRNHWQNEDVINILKHLKLDSSYDHYNYALDQAMEMFVRFEEHYTNPSALAYLTDEDTIIEVGPKKYETTS
jgi:predicted transcriptional regulator